MRTWYCVTSAFYDTGRVVAGVTDSKEADEKPESTFTAKIDRDIYEDWFADITEAADFVKDAKIA